MSDDGERTCPLCAEEMDLTDQQLKPCRCGYEICIWCWHHIIEMAEKDETEARCPACRTPYDKDKVLKVAAANSERIMTEVYSEKKQRSQRAKPKISAEAMKHLSSVRVMQKNLVYITGLPANLCDENILDRKEYFGKYGKVLKVSISRPAGTSSHKTSSNNTFGVYITYSKEDEAVRCIQAVHNYVLEGKSLRACFGTTKYCRAWLRNMVCSNPDCLYLHDIGSQEDSFTKDEIISAYTRSRVPHGALNNTQRRSGNLLPPPADDFHNKGVGLEKHPVKSSCNIVPSQVKGSLPNTIVGKSNALPAAASWGLRGSNCRVLSSSVQCSQSLAKQMVETSNSSTLPSLVMASSKQPSAQHDEVLTKIPDSNVDIGTISSLQLGTLADSRSNTSSETASSGDCSLSSSWNDDAIVASKPGEEMTELDDSSTRLESSSELLTQAVSMIADTSQVSSSCLSSPLALEFEDKERVINLSGSKGKPRNTPILISHVKQINNSYCDEVAQDSTIINSNVQSRDLESSSVNMDGHMVNQLNIDQHHNSLSNHSSAELPRSRGFNSDPVAFSSIESTDWNYEPPEQHLIMNRIEGPLLQLDDSSSCVNHQNNNTNDSSSTSLCNGLGSKQLASTDSSLDTDRKLETSMCSLGDKESVIHNGHRDTDIGLKCLSRTDSQSPRFNYGGETMRPLGRNDITNSNNGTYVDKMGESNIISDILSLDFDPWDDSVSSPNALAKLLGEKEKQDQSFNLPSSLKSVTNNQSRFSFARQESQTSLVEPHVRETSLPQRLYSSSQDLYQDNFQNGLHFSGSEGCIIKIGDTSSDTTNSVLRTKITAPPGFSAASRAPPPGFSCQDRFNQTYETPYISSGGNHYESHSVGNSGDVEFIDPAILAIGKGRIPIESNNSALGLKSSFPPQFITSDSDPRFNVMPQQSISSLRNMGMPDHTGERFLPLNDGFVASRLLAQSHAGISPLTQLSFQQLRNPLFSNGHWDTWNSMRTGNDIAFSEVFRNDRFGLNDYYTSADENKFRIPSAGDLYNQAYGM